MFDFQTMLNNASRMLENWIPDLITALVTLILGLWVVGIIMGVIRRAMKSQKMDPTLQSFLNSIISVTLKVLLIVSVIAMVGIKATSFVAIIGAAGLAVGLALQGSLANFAGGVLILTFKPFKVGDYIEAGGFSGSVNSILIFNTILKTPDNKTIIIPNSQLSNGNIVNYSTEPTRRVDFTFGIGYGDDITKAREVLQAVIKEDKRVFKDPAPQIRVSELADSSVNFAVRVWANTSDYWDIYFDMTEKVKLAFDENGISIPFPQQDVHLIKHND